MVDLKGPESVVEAEVVGLILADLRVRRFRSRSSLLSTPASLSSLLCRRCKAFANARISKSERGFIE